MQQATANRAAPNCGDESPGIRLHASNRLEGLAMRLAEEMRCAPGDPLAPTRIVVPHRTLGRWLALHLATELGVAANLRLELPAQWAWWALRQVAPGLPKEQPFAQAALRWRIFDALAAWRAPGDLLRYLEDDEDADPRKRFELADRLAGFYDACLLYRPDWIRDWQRGDVSHWQARLWRELTRGDERPPHWVGAIDAYEKALESHSDAFAGKRVDFFGVAALSPSYLEVLRRAAAAGMDVHMFQLSPCEEFWADTRGRRERPSTAPDDYYTEGNELLAAWGRPARDMQALLEPELATGAPEEFYCDPAAPTRLAAVQQDVLSLRLAAKGLHDVGDMPADDSLQLHVCHSAMREAEVLHDRLLGLFDDHDDIDPADVLVLTPKLDVYAPAIDAVFSSAAEEIPFHIGRPRRRDRAAVKAFVDLLALPGSRYGAQAVLAPLAANALQTRFDVGDEDLASLREWLTAAGVRWGIDGKHRERLGVPPSDANTWRHGLRRALLGYAISDDAALVEGVAPYTIKSRGFDAGPPEYQLLGRFASYCDLAFALDRWQQREETPEQWAALLRSDILVPFFGESSSANAVTATQIDAVDALIGEFTDQCDAAPKRDDADSSPVPFAVVRDVLGAMATDASRSLPRLADGVTVGDLRNGQIFPAKVVCLVGMNDRDFPRNPTPASFDLVAADERQIGDRDRRDEDRAAFLEALLAARRCLIVTRTGRDQREDSVMPPSVVVSELLDYLGERFPGAGDADEEPCFETEHPLQPFNSRYFDREPDERNGAPLFSYAEPMAAAARALAERTDEDEPPPRIDGRVETDAATSDDMPLHELIAFFANPAKRFVRNRLGIWLETAQDGADADEHFALSGLDAWQVKNDVLDLDLGGVEADHAREVLLAQGRLPHGNPGRVEYAEVSGEMRGLMSALREREAQWNAEPWPVDVEVDGLRVHGAVEHFDAEAGELLFRRVGVIRAKDRIEVWLKLLALACTSDKPLTARLLGTDKKKGKVEEGLVAPEAATAKERLADWLDAWRRGQAAPLPFYPKTSFDYAKTLNGGNKDPMRTAMEAWIGGDRSRGEGEDAYYRLMHGRTVQGHELDGDDFAELAEQLLGPLAEACSK